MSEPRESAQAQENGGASRPGKVARAGLGRAGRWVRGRSVRWVAAGAAVVVIGGGAAAVAVHHEHEGHGGGRWAAAGDHERHDDRGEGQGDGRGEGRGEGRDGEGHRGHEGRKASGHGQGHGHEDGPAAQGALAPAPLPSTDAADALAKAQSVVTGGKVESLTTVAEQGGGRAWRAVVIGPDGVRHVVTVDGATNTVTGNTVLGG